MIDDIDDIWEDLLAAIEERRVIPIVGEDLVRTTTDDGRTVTLSRAVAERLAERLRVDTGVLRADFGLNDVVVSFLQARGRREEVYPKIRAIVRELQPKPPQALLALAGITDFDLFVTLSFDSLMADALNAVRFGGAARAEHIGYAPNKVQDLPAAREKLSAPVVYGLLGKVSAAPDYVITDEDILEFLTALQSESRRPSLLFDELQANNLLIIGCAFPDWLARFFIRIAKNRQLSVQRGETEFLIDDTHGRDPGLVLFLQSFSYGTKIVPMEANAFVTELARRWHERHPPKAAAAAPTGEDDAAAVALPEMPPGAVFLSYAKEDIAPVLKIRQALEDLGVDVWLDKERLEAGDQYDLKIRRNIKGCSFFLPVISRNTERRLEGYFRREWRLAEERSMGIADHVPFVLPLVVDDTQAYSEAVPESFHRAQWTRCPDGEVPSDFESRIVKLVREHRKREKGLA